MYEDESESNESASNFFLAMRLLLCFLLVLSVTQAAWFTSCKITASSYLLGGEPPRPKVLLTANGTISMNPSPGAPSPLFSLIKAVNISNGAALHPEYEEDTYYLSGSTLSFFVVEERGQIGEVQVKYEKQPYQPYDITVGGTAVTEFELNCTNDLLTTLFHAETVDPPGGGTREIHIFFTADVKRCDTSADVLLNNSWFVYVSSEPTIANITGPCNTTLSHGFVPYQGSRSHWYCVASNSIANATGIDNIVYTLAEGYICDALDDHNVTTHGYGDNEELYIEGSAATIERTLTGSLYPNGTIYMFSIVPPNSFANFSAVRPCVWIYSTRTHSAHTCCNPRAASWIRPDAVGYQCASPYLAYGFGDDIDFKLLGETRYYYALPGNPAGTYAPQVPGFNFDGTSNFRMVLDERIKGIYRVDAFNLRVTFYQSVGNGMAVTNLIVFDDTRQYNASNVTRYDSHSANYAFSATNELPALSSAFKAYFIQFGASEDSDDSNVPYPSITPMVITAVPVEPTPASTGNKGADLDDLKDEWKAFVWVGWGLAAAALLLFLSYFIYKRRDSLLATAYPHNL